MKPFSPDRWVYYPKFQANVLTWREEDLNKWWDVKKVEPKGGEDANMCWAASASNALHYWTYHNKANIDKYYQLNSDKTPPNTTFSGSFDSGIFRYIKKYWDNKGSKTEHAVQWWTAGFTGKDGGGYFKDVFTTESKKVYDTIQLPTKKTFNEFITKALLSGDALTWSFFISELHATTVYGAKYDSDGWIRTIYYADNNDGIERTETREVVSIKEANIIYYDSGVPLPKYDLETNIDYQTDPVPHVASIVEGWANDIMDVESYSLR